MYHLFFPSLLHKCFTSLWLLSVDLKHDQKVTCIAKLLTMSKCPLMICAAGFRFSTGRVFSLSLVVSVSISPLLPKALCFLSFALWVVFELYFLLCWLLWSSAGCLCSPRAADDYSHLCELVWLTQTLCQRYNIFIIYMLPKILLLIRLVWSPRGN